MPDDVEPSYLDWSDIRELVSSRFQNLIDLFSLLQSDLDEKLEELESIPLNDDEKILELCKSIDTMLAKFPNQLTGSSGYSIKREDWNVEAFGNNFTKRAYELLLLNIIKSKIKESFIQLDESELTVPAPSDKFDILKDLLDINIPTTSEPSPGFKSIQESLKELRQLQQNLNADTLLQQEPDD